MNMADIKVITVILGDGGKIATTFNDTTGELRLYPNEQVERAPASSALYELSQENSLWCMADTTEELEAVEKD